jgi:hypothetical protein
MKLIFPVLEFIYARLSTQRSVVPQAQRLPFIVSIKHRTHYNDSRHTTSSLDDGLDIIECVMTTMLASAVSPACSPYPSCAPIYMGIFLSCEIPPFHIILSENSKKTYKG